VFFQPEGGRLESIHIVARLASTTVYPLRKLISVWARLVTVSAILKCNLLLEITTRVAFLAADLDVFSDQRVLGLRVIEPRADVGERNRFPAAGAVARLTGTREASFVRIGMAGIAPIEWQIGVARFSPSIRNVAFLTSNLYVCASQRILGLGVVERRGCFPALEVVARLAIGAKPSLVLVAMATATLL
jgi:hypothetical protein